ncbi:MAG: potassium transporter TrkG [Legionellaceae bacterium]|nr:potassium transporter TrkG [Legionellaceae bacterium]
MQYKAILRLLGVLLLIFSQSMLTPIIINIIFKEHVWAPFLISYALTLLTGSCLWWFFRNCKSELKIRDGFLLVVLFWFVLIFFASQPFILAVDDLTSMTDAIFETVSGITTTGATVIHDLEAVPRSVIFYRQQLQFIGGIGIVILAVAILPMLGVGGMQLFRAETPGPMKDTKLTPRITQSAKAIWTIYLLLTLLCAVFYYSFGMSWFDALGESFATVSTGGFSVHNASFAYYKNDIIRLIASLFMLLGGTNFALHFVAFKKMSLNGYRRDDEFRFYLGIILAASIFFTYNLARHADYGYNFHTIVSSVFTTISLATTTGFGLENVAPWKSVVPFLAMLLMFLGGCAASTSGGIKVLRAFLMFKQSRREYFCLLHPQAVMPIKLNGHSLPESTLQSVSGFVATFIGLYVFLVLIFMSLGHNLETSFATVTASLTNSGFGIGNLHVDFSTLDFSSKWLLIVTMLTGRLEILSILILFTREFWKK